jgi:putative oxidoreductase
MREAANRNSTARNLRSVAPEIEAMGIDLGLLLLRLWFGAALFLKHGWEKPVHFAAMAVHFPDPVHIGPVPSLVIATLSDAVCSVLVVLGLATRWAALFIFANLFVAWALVHHFQFLAHGADHGELTVLYLGAYLALALTGAGRFSLDARLFRRFR